MPTVVKLRANNLTAWHVAEENPQATFCEASQPRQRLVFAGIEEAFALRFEKLDLAWTRSLEEGST